MTKWGNVQPSLDNSEHIGPDTTGDNVHAKKVVVYGWNGAEWGRQSQPFLTKPFDEVILTYTDDTKATLDTIVTKLSGVTQETVTYNEPTTSSERYVRS